MDKATKATLMREKNWSVRWKSGELPAVALLGVAAVIRAAFLAADPPSQSMSGIPWVDEASWTHNARNRVLFGSWQVDHYNPGYVSPTFTALSFIGFASFGVGTWQARLTSLVAGVGVLMVFYALLAREHGRRVGLVGLALAGTDYMLIMYSRVALIEMLLLFFMVLCAYCFCRARESLLFAFASGVAAGAVPVTKGSGVFIIAVPVVTSLWLMSQGEGRKQKRREVRRLIMYSIGLLVVVATWLGMWVVPNWSFLRVSLSVGPKHLALSASGLLFNILVFPIAHPIFARMLPVTILGLLGAWAMLRSLGGRGIGASESSVFFVNWLILGTLMIQAFDMFHQRRYVALILPLIGLAALWWTPSGGMHVEEPPKMPGGGRARRLLLGVVMLYGLYWMLGAVSRVIAFDLSNPVFPGVRYRHLILGALVSAVVIWAIIGRLDPRAVESHRNRPFRAMILALILTVAIVGNLWQYAGWAWKRSYTVLDTSRSLASIVPAGAYVLGDAAISLSWENNMRPLFVNEVFGVGASFGRRAWEIDPRQRAEARFILVHSNPRDQADPEIQRLLAEAVPGPPLREFPLYDWIYPGQSERVLLFQRKAGRLSE